MSTHYVLFPSGAGSFDGTSEANAAASVSSLTVASGDTIYLKGESQNDPISISGAYDNVTIAPWPSIDDPDDLPFIRGDTEIAYTDWTDEADGTFSATIASTPASVCWNWKANVDSNGFHFGHLALAENLAACQSTDGTYYYTGGTLYVNPPTEATNDPDSALETDIYSWCVKTQQGVSVGGDGITIRGLRIGNWSDQTAGYGYGIILAGKDCLVEDCAIWDSGYHHFGFVGPGGTNNLARRCSFYGYSSIALAVYGSSNAVGALIEDCRIYRYRRLGSDGDPLSTSPQPGGIIGHSGAVLLLQNIEFRRLYMNDYDDGLTSAGISNLSDSSVVTKANGYNSSRYPIRFVDCDITTNYIYLSSSGNNPAYVAFQRCKLDMRSGATTGVSAVKSAISIWRGRMLLEACNILVNCDATHVDSCVYGRNESLGCAIHLVNTSVINTGSGANCHLLQSNGATYTKFYVHNCILVHTENPSGSRMLGGTGWDTSLEFTGNWINNCSKYVGILAGDYDTEAEFLANWPSNTTSLDPELDSANYYIPANGMGVIIIPTTQSQYSCYYGINGSKYSGLSGPYQTGYHRNDVWSRGIM